MMAHPRAKTRHSLAAALLAVPIGAMALPAAAAESTAIPPFLLSVASAGHTVLAAGENGLILRSTDDGRHFLPVPAPGNATLTRIVMAANNMAYAVGFDATILRSADGGAHWRRVLNDPRADNPLFGLATTAQGAALAVGGFGHAYTSANGIAWQPADIRPPDEDTHLNDVINISASEWLLVGEQALIMRSQDAGAHWQKFDAPVQGSLFGAVALGPARWLVFGLRGHVLATEDAGTHWHDIKSGTTAELLGATRLHDGRAVIVGNRGTALLVDADLQSVHALPLPGRDAYADCAQLPDGSVVAVGEAGMRIIAIPPPSP